MSLLLLRKVTGACLSIGSTCETKCVAARTTECAGSRLFIDSIFFLFETLIEGEYRVQSQFEVSL